MHCMRALHARTACAHVPHLHPTASAACLAWSHALAYGSSSDIMPASQAAKHHSRPAGAHTDLVAACALWPAEKPPPRASSSPGRGGMWGVLAMAPEPGGLDSWVGNPCISPGKGKKPTQPPPDSKGRQGLFDVLAMRGKPGGGGAGPCCLRCCWHAAGKRRAMHARIERLRISRVCRPVQGRAWGIVPQQQLCRAHDMLVCRRVPFHLCCAACTV